MKRTKNEFPHPLLYSNSDDYINSSFELFLNNQKILNDNLLIEAEYKLLSKTLQTLLAQNKAEIVIKVESSKASYRNIFLFNKDSDKLTIEIDKNKVADKLEISAVIIAKTVIEQFTSDEFNKNLFGNAFFEIRKGDILAQDIGYTIELDATELEGPVASVFEISRQNIDVALKPDFLQENGKIGINLSFQVRDIYDELRNKNHELKKYLAAVIVLPVLVEAIGYIQGIELNSKEEYFEYSDKRWYRAILKKIKYKQVDLQLPATEIANMLLGDIIKSALISFKETIDNSFDGEIESGGID